MTIRLRLTIYWAGVITMLLLCGAVAVFLVFQRQQWDQLDGALMEEADTSAEAIARGAQVAPMVAQLSEERDLGPRRRVWVTVGPHTIAAAGDNRAGEPDLKVNSVAPSLVSGRDGIFRYAIRPFWLKGAAAYLAVGVDARAVRESVRRLLTSLLLVLPVLLICSVSVGYWLAGRALAPLASITDALADIRPRDLSRRLADTSIDDEPGRLIRAINGLLERVERASFSERRFAVDAAHELRTPLAVLRSGIEVILRRKRTDREYERALERALHDVATVGALADDLLAFTRLDQELSLDRAAIDLRCLAEEVIETIEPVTAAKHLSIETTLTAATVQGNREHLRRLIVNVLDNALKFTPEGGRVEVALESCNGRVELRIADSGPGIQQEELPLIFERFFRGQNGRNNSGKGLGLSLCREIVELHGGKISVTSRPGNGAEFLISLPATPFGA
jgi:signal transduction histidine kinase